MRFLTLLVASLLLAPGLASAAGPEALPDRFIAAWNAHDPKGFEALYTPDSVWVPVAEERTEGREAIVGEFAKIHTGGGWAMKTTIVKKDVPEVHLLRPDVATIFFRVDFLMNGQPVPGVKRTLILVTTATNGEWKISAGQLTKESPAE
ncbi:hypothetical protein BH10PSE4_BH10PSE4_46820 [soil metagenome]